MGITNVLTKGSLSAFCVKQDTQIDVGMRPLEEKSAIVTRLELASNSVWTCTKRKHLSPVQGRILLEKKAAPPTRLLKLSTRTVRY